MSDEQKGKSTIVDLRQVGDTGLRRFSGFIYQEILQELTGWRGAAVYKEMSSNDATISGILFAIDKLCRRVPWRVESASDQPFDKEAAEFVEQCLDDMNTTWIDTIGDILSFLAYGFSVHEIIYKRRCGDDFDPSMRSKYSDGRIGWRALSPRSQDTIYRWQFSDHGEIQGVEQLAPPHYYHVTIPIEKFLLFRTTSHLNNPEGLSILRGAYTAWYRKKNIENIEAIGVERDLCGMPMAFVPPEYLSSGASNSQKELLSQIKNIVVNVRRDEQEGMVLPLIYDSNGKPLFDFKLLSSGGTRQLDVDKIVQRYDQRIAMSMMADFMLLGQNGQGSFAMHSDKTKLFSMALGSYLDIIAETLNRFAIPRLFALNDFAISDFPKIVHGDVESRNLGELGAFITQLASAGMPLFPNADLENYLLKVADLPEGLDSMQEEDMQVAPKYSEPIQRVQVKSDPMERPTDQAMDHTDTTPVNDKPPVETVTNDSGDTERTARMSRNNQQGNQFVDRRF
jgi:hypothetical protein